MQDLLVGIVGESLAPIVSVLLAAVFVVVLVILVIALAKNLLGGRIGIGASGAPRLAVVDAIGVDQRRKLVLLRRDGVEHLVLIGGPNDILVENNIGRVPAAPPAQRREPEIAVPRAASPARPASPPVTAQAPRAAASAGGAAPVAPDAPARNDQAPLGATSGTSTPTAPAQRREPAPLVEIEDVQVPQARTTTPVTTPVQKPDAPERPAPREAPRVEASAKESSVQPPVVAPAVSAQRRDQAPPSPAPVVPRAPQPQSPPAPARPQITPSFPLSRATPVLPPEQTEPRDAAAKAEEPGPKPLSVRSFASTIQNRVSGESTPTAPVSAPEKSAPARPEPPVPQEAQPAKSSDDDGLEDLLATAFIDEDDRDAKAGQVAHDAPPKLDENRGNDKSASLEEEMERLLRDFTTQAGDRR